MLLYYVMVPEPDLNKTVSTLYLLLFLNLILTDTNDDTNKCNSQASA